MLWCFLSSTHHTSIEAEWGKRTNQRVFLNVFESVYLLDALAFREATSPSCDFVCFSFSVKEPRWFVVPTVLFSSDAHTYHASCVVPHLLRAALVTRRSTTLRTLCAPFPDRFLYVRSTVNPTRTRFYNAIEERTNHCDIGVQVCCEGMLKYDFSKSRIYILKSTVTKQEHEGIWSAAFSTGSYWRTFTSKAWNWRKVMR